MNKLTISITDNEKRERNVLVMGTNHDVDSLTSIVIDGLEETNNPVNKITEDVQKAYSESLEAKLRKLNEVFWVDVESDWIQRAGFNFHTNAIWMSTNIGDYEFDNKSVDLFFKFLNAPSKGEFYHKFLR